MAHIIHRAEQRGEAEHGWLHARFSFSFAEYHNPNRMGFGVLRVMNNDVIEAGQGFSLHPHKDMEIITLILKGSLEHEDSQGRHGIINAGEVQYMSAGEGIYHSEKNPSHTESVELFQIWIYPKERGGKPLYEKKNFETMQKKNAWNIIVSPDARENSLQIKQDAQIYTVKLDAQKELILKSPSDSAGRLLLVIEGSIEVVGELLNKRDEIQITDTNSYTIKSLTNAELLLLEVPMHKETI